MPALFSRLSLSVFFTCALLASPVAYSQTQPNQGESWTINLKGADIGEFIDQVASITGQTFVVDPRVKGQVSVISSTPLDINEVYQLFLSVMSTHGFTVIAQGDQARVIPNADAKAEADTGRPAPDRLETRLIQVQQVPVTELIQLIRPLVPQYGHLAAVTSSNSLIISDRSANIERILNLVRQLDRSGAQDYSVITLQHAWVRDAADLLHAAIDRGQAKGSGSVQIIADSRANRLILLGPSEARSKLIELARTLDSPSSRSANTRVIRLKHASAKDLAQTLGEISQGLGAQGSSETTSSTPNILIRADESLNALVMLAEPDIVAALEDIVRQLDIPRAQVMVEAAIVEVSGDISDALGVQWAVDGRRGGAGGVNFSGAGLSVGTVLSLLQSDNTTDVTLPDGAIIGVGTDRFGALITALSANSNSNLLSTPSLLTLDNQKAEILVGQNVPFQTGSYTTDAAGASNPFTTIERKDIGVTLKVTPHINDGATLRLQIEQEISSIAPSAGLNAVDLITNKRAIKSTILANDGQVIVLGGLIQDDVTESQSKVPVLGDIPLVGSLFRATRTNNVKRNLMVFLRPTVVRDAAGMSALSGSKYSDLQILGQNGASNSLPSILPSSPTQLFDRSAPAIDLRP